MKKIFLAALAAFALMTPACDAGDTPPLPVPVLAIGDEVVGSPQAHCSGATAGSGHYKVIDLPAPTTVLMQDTTYPSIVVMVARVCVIPVTTN